MATKPFNVRYTCVHCGQQTTAETGFGRWMRNHRSLDSANGIVRTDTDHTVLRYKTHGQGREFQLLIDIEVKEFGAEPDASQADILAMKHQLLFIRGSNIHGSPTVLSREVKSRLTGRMVNARYLGYHLLQFEKTDPMDSRWIRWDRKEITEDQLVNLLALELDPYNPDRAMIELLRDRHKQEQLPLVEA